MCVIQGAVLLGASHHALCIFVCAIHPVQRISHGCPHRAGGRPEAIPPPQLILNGAKTLETRKWPVFEGFTGPLLVHCAYHEWEGGDKVRQWVEEELGAEAAELSLRQPWDPPARWVCGCARVPGWPLDQGTVPV